MFLASYTQMKHFEVMLEVEWGSQGSLKSSGFFLLGLRKLRAIWLESSDGDFYKHEGNEGDVALNFVAGRWNLYDPHLRTVIFLCQQRPRWRLLKPLSYCLIGQSLKAAEQRETSHSLSGDQLITAFKGFEYIFFFLSFKEFSFLGSYTENKHGRETLPRTSTLEATSNKQTKRRRCRRRRWKWLMYLPSRRCNIKWNNAPV